MYILKYVDKYVGGLIPNIIKEFDHLDDAVIEKRDYEEDGLEVEIVELEKVYIDRDNFIYFRYERNNGSGLNYGTSYHPYSDNAIIERDAYTNLELKEKRWRIEYWEPKDLKDFEKCIATEKESEDYEM